MKIRIYFLVMLAVLSVNGISQTLYVPSGTSGIGSSSNTSVGIGLSNPTQKLEVAGRIKANNAIMGQSAWSGYAWFTNSNSATTDGYALLHQDNGTTYLNAASEKPIHFRIGNATKMYLAPNGNIGMGTTSPTKKLDVSGDINFSGNLYKNGSLVSIGGSDSWSKSGSDIYFNTGKVGIGTTSPTQKLDVRGLIVSSAGFSSYSTNPLYLKTNGTTRLTIESGGVAKFANTVYLPDNSSLVLGASMSTGMRLFYSSGYKTNFIDFATGNLFFRSSKATPLIVQENGSVGVGFAPTLSSLKQDYCQGSKLAVNGSILCEKIKVISDVPASDFVFEDDYKLPSLQEVKKFVKENKHLPEVPSAKEFKENGYNIGEMDDVLLRKVEELTLYVISLKEENLKLQERIENLEK